MRRWLPYPLLTLALSVMWLLLNQSFSLGHLLLGAVVAVLSTYGLAALRPEPVRIVSLRPVLRLLFTVAIDIIRSNIAVARIVLFGKRGIAEFVRLPLELNNINALTVLALYHRTPERCGAIQPRHRYPPRPCSDLKDERRNGSVSSRTGTRHFC